MSDRAPRSDLSTHVVSNQVDPFEDVNLFDTDRARPEQGNLVNTSASFDRYAICQ